MLKNCQNVIGYSLVNLHQKLLADQVLDIFMEIIYNKVGQKHWNNPKFSGYKAIISPFVFLEYSKAFSEKFKELVLVKKIILETAPQQSAVPKSDLEKRTKQILECSEKSKLIFQM